MDIDTLFKMDVGIDRDLQRGRNVGPRPSLPLLASFQSSDFTLPLQISLSAFSFPIRPETLWLGWAAAGEVAVGGGAD